MIDAVNLVKFYQSNSAAANLSILCFFSHWTHIGSAFIVLVSMSKYRRFLGRWSGFHRGTDTLCLECTWKITHRYQLCRWTRYSLTEGSRMNFWEWQKEHRWRKDSHKCWSRQGSCIGRSWWRGWQEARTVFQRYWSKHDLRWIFLLQVPAG